MLTGIPGYRRVSGLLRVGCWRLYGIGAPSGGQWLVMSFAAGRV